MKTFPTLYKKASTGKMWSWQISVNGAAIIETWGEIGGKQQSTSDTIKEGKNLGRANATTPEEQALLEAEAKWTKKLSGHNYNESREAAEKGESSNAVEGGVLPMLAHKYSEQGDKIKWPAFAQRKYDGARMTAVPTPEGVTLWSRTRKQMFSVPHIQKALDRLWSVFGTPVVLDGECYSDAYKDKFEKLMHFIRQSKYIPGSEVVEYHIYDCVVEGMPFSERIAKLRRLLTNEPKGTPLKLVETIEVADEDELLLAFEKFRAEGMEGAMVRNAAGLYVPRRSYDLQKVKEFDDAEFPIVGVTEGRGKMQGRAVFVCETSKGIQFEAKMKGEIAKLKQYWDNPKLAVGKKLTVQYQGLTTKNKVPRFPVALRLAEAL